MMAVPALTFGAHEKIKNGLRWGKGNVQIPEKTFEEDYRPVEAPTGDEGAWAWHFEEVQDIPVKHVWTVVDTGDEKNDWIATAGFHIVNKVHYLVTNVPWSTGAEHAMWFEGEEGD